MGKDMDKDKHSLSIEWQLVPKEPTKEMMQAGFDVRGSHLYGLTYRAMLDAAPAPPELATTRKIGVTLTGKEIREIAELAGLQFVEHDYVDEYETEVTIETPSGFLLNDDGVEEHYRLIAYLTEYPEEGAIGLGDALSITPIRPDNPYADDEHE
jgi:hypothetical protein